MSKELYTPGYWVAVGAWVEHARDDIPDICTCNPEAFCQGHMGRSYDEICANARLCAAAPSMLQALSAMLRARTPEQMARARGRAVNAVEKAKGRRFA